MDTFLAVAPPVAIPVLVALLCRAWYLIGRLREREAALKDSSEG